jgi:RND family efflux transporter MFP subunit
LIQAGTSSNTQAMPLVRLSENGRLRLILPVPESVVPKVRLGESVDIRMQSSGQTLVGTVSRFSGKVDPATRTMEVEVDVPNPDLKLTPGMYASATLTLDKQNNAIAVTPQAIANQETNPTVLVVGNDNRIEERTVKLGLETDSKIEVLAGLNEGDMVIVGNRSQYKAGQTVEPKLISSSKPEGGR